MGYMKRFDAKQQRLARAVANTTVKTTMQRRTFVIGLGALSTGTAAAVGTGAFTSVTADRDVEVAVAEDADAFLSLSPSDGANGAFAEQTGDEETIEFDIDEDAEGVDGSGLNPNATTVIAEIFDIENQGTQEVGVQVTADLGDLGDGEFTIFAGEDTDDDLSDGWESLDTGEVLSVGVEIVTGDPADLDGTVTIEADADEV